MEQKIKVTPDILRWARKSGKISLEKAAKTISKTCKPERIKEWESEDCKDFPTIKQLAKLARLYRRPVDIFFLKYIPKDYPPLKDFRTEKETGLNTALIFMMREIQEKQEWLHNFLVSKREKKIDFTGKYNVKSDPETVAKDIRSTLKINQKENILKPLKYWIEQAEKKRIFVSLTSNFHTRLKLDSDVFKGFAIADNQAPFIFLNSDDWDHNQLVTFVHELAHLWIGVSGISNDTSLSENNYGNTHIVERFCKKVTEYALLPEDEIKIYFPDENISFKHIATASRKIGVNTQTILKRIYDLELTDESSYSTFKKEADKVWKEYLFKESQKAKSSGGPNYYIMQLRRCGKSFSNIVLESFNSGRISGTDASRLLNVKQENFGKFSEYVFK